MKVVYYYVLYLRAKDNQDFVEIHLKPFSTKEEAENFRKEWDARFGERVVFSKVRRTDLSNSKNGIWL